MLQSRRVKHFPGRANKATLSFMAVAQPHLYKQSEQLSNFSDFLTLGSRRGLFPIFSLIESRGESCKSPMAVVLIVACASKLILRAVLAYNVVYIYKAGISSFLPPSVARAAHIDHTDLQAMRNRRPNK